MMEQREHRLDEGYEIYRFAVVACWPLGVKGHQPVGLSCTNLVKETEVYVALW